MYIRYSILIMDKSFELNGISFIWDANKAKINERNHKVTFEQAAEAFFDPFLTVVDASPAEEVRDATIGMDKHWNLLFVVHILIEDDSVRIISARNATRSEKLAYEN